MRIALATSQVPFVRGGAELLTESLHRELVARGHHVEIVQIPFNWYPIAKLMDSMNAAKLLDLEQLGGHAIDLVIGLKFPAYFVRHPNKVFWLLHQHRQAYDLWGHEHNDLMHQPQHDRAKDTIWDADRAAFAGQRMYTISQNVSDRLQTYLGIASRALYHPPPIADLLSPGTLGDYLLVPSRLNPLKRQDLVLRALAASKQPIRAIFVGAPDDNRLAAELKALALELELADRVTWRSFVSADELASLYNNARAVVFVPRNEDYGYVTLEAMLAGKAIVTVDDSGGPLEFVEDGRSGLISAPTPDALGASLSEIWTNRGFASRLGQGALRRYHDLGIGWDGVIAELLGEAQPDKADAMAAAATPARATEPTTAETVVEETSDLDAIKRRCGVETPKDLLAAFDFGRDLRDAHRAHLAADWERDLHAAALLPQRPGLRVLTLNSHAPHLVCALAKLANPSATFDALVQGDESGRTDSAPSRRGMTALDVTTQAANLETDRFPYADATFDVVLAIDVVEHLAIDPAHLFAEAARVLRPDGIVLVTTPNIVSDAALRKLWRGDAPYASGAFTPSFGLYGRHNREYVPAEIAQLGAHGGFATTTLVTRNVRPAADQQSLPTSDETRVASEMRGDTIFYVGTKDATARGDLDATLYAEDADAVRGALVAHAPRPPSTDIALVLRNDGTSSWSDRTFDLVIRVIGGEVGRGKSFRGPLPVFVAPGESKTLDLPLAPRSGQASCVLLARLERRDQTRAGGGGVTETRFLADAEAIDQLAALLRAGA